MIQRKKPQKKRRLLSRREYVVLITLLTISLLLLVVLWPRIMRARELRACQENLKELGQAFGMYTAESRRGMFPRVKLKDCNGAIQPFSGAIDLDGFFPEYINDLDLFVCPAYEPGQTAVELWDEGKTDNPRWEEAVGFSRNGTVEPCEMLGKPYYYFGWALADMTFGPSDRWERPDPEDVLPENAARLGMGSLRVTDNYVPRIHNMRFRLATLTEIGRISSPSFDAESNSWKFQYPSGKDLQLPYGNGVPFLQEEIERFYIRDIGNPAGSANARAKIVVMHEDVKHDRILPYINAEHGNVLYMDGHVESLFWWTGSKYPYNEPGQILRDAANGTLEPPQGIKWQDQQTPAQ